MEDNTFKIYERDDLGEVRITEDVIAVIAGLAATEVEGVRSLEGNVTNEIVSKLGRKNLAAGVKAACADGCASVSLSIEVEMGFSIIEVSRAVQESVKNAVEGMTGLVVNAVDVEVAGVAIAKE